MKLIIAEKPSVAKNLAACLDTGVKKFDGYLEGDNYTYSWAIGHLVTLANANSYCENPWSLSNIPIIPNEFELIPSKKTFKQFSVLKSLISKSNEIINAADAGREGELIFRYILNLCSTNAEIKRLWISSYTNESILNGFNNLEPSTKYDSLYFSGKARSEADWLFGINATIALTKKIDNGEVFSLGRVQTPTFALICSRYIENKSFKPVPFYVPSLDLIHNEIKFNSNFQGNQILDKNEALKIINDLPSEIECVKANKSTKKVSPPLCFDLTSLQIKANNAFGLTADTTLKITQELYEIDKAVSYPRTDSRYLNADQIGNVETLLNGFIKIHGKIENYLLDDISNSKSFNSNKVTDHHAIIPTSFEILTDNWSTEKLNIYNLILSQFFMAFGKTAISELVKYEFKNKDFFFKTSETVFSFVGWKFFDKSKTSESSLPEVKEGDLIKIVEATVLDKKTKAKDIYTDATLLTAMTSAGKDFDIEELPAEIKRKGIGTPATRASIIETLLKRKYITRNKKLIIPTEKGMNLYSLIKNFRVANVKLTGDWEEQLYLIEEGKVEYQKFLDLVKLNLNKQIIPEIKNIDTSSLTVKETIKGSCPKCKSKIKSGFKTLECESESCDFLLWKTVGSKKLTQKEIESLLSLEITLVKGLISKTKKTFDGKLFLDPKSDFKLKYHIENTPTTLKCCSCQNLLNDRGSFYSCSSESCNFSLSKIIAKKKLSESSIATLLEGKKTPLIKGFISKSKKPFNASLVLENNKVVFKF